MKRKKVDLLKCSSLLPDGPGSPSSSSSTSHVDKLLSVHDRVIAHIDLDCFYVQVERSLDPTLRSKPVAVVQYNPFGDLRTYLPSDNRIVSSGSLIAVSYEARAAGVKRIMRGQEAKKACPELLLVQVPTSHGKANLGIYRDASSRILKVLSSTSYSSCIIERASIDEVYVDVTAEASKLLEQAADLRLFLQSSIKLLLSVPTLIAGVDDEEVSMNKSQIRNGHKGTELMQHSYLNDDNNQLMSIPDEVLNSSSSSSSLADLWFLRPQHMWSTQDLMLIAGSIVVNDLRKAVLQQLGFTCSAGIATNRMLAKTCSGMHKPNKQTILPVAFISSLMTSLPYSRVQGLGGKLGEALSQLYDGKVKTMGDIAAIDRKEFIQRFGEETAAWLYNVSRGVDVEPVMDRPLPISIGCSKSFRSSNMLTPKHLSDGTVLKWLTELSEELHERLSDDMQQNNRVPKSLQAGASIKFQLLSSSSSSDTLSGNDNKQNESGSKDLIAIPIEDRVEQWHEDQGISLSKICPMVSGGPSAMAKTALQMLTRAIHEHPKICSLNVKSNSSSSIATSGSPNKLTATSSSSSSGSSIIVPQYSWNITYLSMCVNNFQTIENGSNSITSYFKAPSSAVGHSDKPLDDGAFLCAESHSSTSLNVSAVNDEKLTLDEESTDTLIQRQYDVDHNSVVEVVHTERTQEEEEVSSNCGRSIDKIFENMTKTQDNNQMIRAPQSVTASITSKVSLKPEHRMITSFFSHATMTKRSISVINSSDNSADGHLDQRDDSRSSKTSNKTQCSGNGVIATSDQQLTTQKKSSDAVLNKYCIKRVVIPSQSTPLQHHHLHMPATMRDIDSSVFLSLPHDIQREIELTLKLRQQRNHSTK